jgi:Flp pilus assembly protein TadG
MMVICVKHLTKKARAVWDGLRSERRRGQDGQSLILVIFAFIGLLAFAGLAVDLGLFYVQRVQVSRAADAASLAAVSDLPMEDAAHQRALTYLQDNGYDHTKHDVLLGVDTFTSTTGGGVYAWEPSVPSDVSTVIWVDTKYSRDTASPNPEDTASRIRVRVMRMVPTFFLQFLGFDRLPAEAMAEAENINRIDSVIVYDDSASMEFNTVCYGCWEPDPNEMYPKGTIYPLHWSESSTTDADHCAHNCVITPVNYSDYEPNTTYEYNDCHYREKDVADPEYYIVIEAEEYSQIHPDYQPLVGQPYHTFWVIQRNGRNSYYHGDYPDGAYIRHHPFGSRTSHFDGIALPCEADDVQNGYCVSEVPGYLSMPEEERTYVEDILPQPAPRADYGLEVPVTDSYYFWVRGQGGDGGNINHIFWGLDQTYKGEEDGFPRQGNIWEGADPDDWEWRCLNCGGGGEWLTGGAQRTLNLWAGGSAFSVDRMLITTESNLNLPEPGTFPSNKGRTGWACDPCDPRFAGRPGGGSGSYGVQPDCLLDNRLDPIYDDEQPIRDALEAAKYFVSRLDIRLDQVGYVAYDGSAHIRDELQCLRRLGPEDLGAADCDPDPPSGYDTDCGCHQRVITETILAHLDTAVASGGTNIPHAIELGIEVLSTGGSHYGRPGAAHVMILMTDGETHNYPGSCSGVEDLWPYNTGDSSVDIAKDCSVHFANIAHDNGIVMYTIGLGVGADKPLLQYLAEITGGRYYPATQDNLSEVFDKLYERIFIRLIK